MEKHRQIRVRAWDDINKEMIYPVYDMLGLTRTDGDILSRYEIVMLCSGLKDGNGKEIYEEDILELVNEDGKKITVICKFGTVQRELRNFVGDIHSCEITGFHFLIKNRYPTFPVAKNYLGVCDLEIMTIIGNTYENKDKLI